MGPYQRRSYQEVAKKLSDMVEKLPKKLPKKRLVAEKVMRPKESREK
jgi:hypothetical protein